MSLASRVPQRILRSFHQRPRVNGQTGLASLHGRASSIGKSISGLTPNVLRPGGRRADQYKKEEQPLCLFFYYSLRRLDVPDIICFLRPILNKTRRRGGVCNRFKYSSCAFCFILCLCKCVLLPQTSENSNQLISLLHTFLFLPISTSLHVQRCISSRTQEVLTVCRLRIVFDEVPSALGSLWIVPGHHIIVRCS